MYKEVFLPVTIGVSLAFFAKRYVMDDTTSHCAPSLKQIDGKVAIVTGGNSGIGKETARELVKRGGKVYLACRSLDRGHAAAQDIMQTTGANDSQVVTLKLDLASLTSVRQFAQDFKKKEDRLDILINNAGVAWIPYAKTEDGFEMQFGTNHLGHFLLVALLLDRLMTSAPSRVVVVSSRAHARGAINFDDVMSEKAYSRFRAYQQSKLANVLFAREFARRLEGTGVIAHSLHPGIIGTDIGRSVPVLGSRLLYPLFQSVASYFGKSCAEGAQTSVYCAVENEPAQCSGMYYSDCAQRKPAPQAQDDVTAKRLWRLSRELVHLAPGETDSRVMDD